MPGGIIPWSGGTRTPITYGLRPGQFRNTRVNVFPNQTIINNNIGNFGTYGYYDDCCGGGGNKMGWFDWTMLGGMGLNFFGNLLGCVFGGSSKKSEGPGDTPTPRSDLDLKNLNALYKADGYTIVQNEDGSFTAKKKGEPAITGKDRAELESLLNDAMKKPEAVVQPIVTEEGDGASDVAGAGNTPAVAPPPTFTRILTTGQGDTSSINTAKGEEDYFKQQTSQDPFKITSTSKGITITALSDKGNSTTVSGKIKISDKQMSELNKNDQAISLGKFKGKDVTAKKLSGGYIELTVGSQTYIVGSDNKGYQFKDGKVTGYKEANWRGGK